MSGIKTINSANSGLKRPFRLSDLQNVWDGLTEALASETLNSATPIKIVSGLHVIGGKLSPGVIAYNGKLYYYEGETDDNGGFPEGNDMYVATIDGGDRTLSTGLVQPFDFNNVIRNSKVNDGAVLIISNVTEDTLSKYRYVPNVNGSAIEDGAINTEKLVSMSVTTDKIDDAAVTTDKIDAAAVTPEKCSDAPFVRSGVSIHTGDYRIDNTGLFIVTLQPSQTTISFGPSVPGVVHIIAKNTTSQATTVRLTGPNSFDNYGSFSAASNSQYAITVRFPTESIKVVVEVRKLDFFQSVLDL